MYIFYFLGIRFFKEKPFKRRSFYTPPTVDNPVHFVASDHSGTDGEIPFPLFRCLHGMVAERK